MTRWGGDHDRLAGRWWVGGFQWAARGTIVFTDLYGTLFLGMDTVRYWWVEIAFFLGSFCGFLGFELGMAWQDSVSTYCTYSTRNVRKYCMVQDDTVGDRYCITSQYRLIIYA